MHDVIIVGGGASGLMCAANAGNRGLNVLLLEKNPKVGLKILVSGGGRCNFTNLTSDPRLQFLSQNPHFCISAMKRYGPLDFVGMVDAHGIKYHEKKLGQLFCDNSAKDIVAMHLSECAAAGVDIRVGQEVTTITPEQGNTFRVTTKRTIYTAKKVVIASGGLSLPKIASDLAFRVAKGLGVNVVAPRAALVPLLWNSSDKGRFGELSGISADADVRCNGVGFRENILFTHRGSRRFLSNYIPPYLSFRPSSASRKQLHSSTMRLFPLLDHGRKSGAIWYVIFRQSPKRSRHSSGIVLLARR